MYRLIVIFILPLGLTAFAQFDNSDQIWNEGIEFIHQGDYLRAYERLSKFIKLNPENARAYNNRAICSDRLGDLEHCCGDFEMAKSLNSNKNQLFHRLTCNNDLWIKRFNKYYYRDMEIYPELGLRPRYTRSDSLRGALRSQRTCFDVYYYDLTVRILPRSKSITGSNEIWFRGVHSSREIQLDLFEQYIIESITMDGEELTFKREYNAVFIQLPWEIVPGKEYKITVEYSGKPEVARDPPWFGGFVWARDKRMNRWVSVVCEHLGASSWWPNKDHLSDRSDSMGIHIEVPRKYNAVSNGQLRSIEESEDNYERYNWFVSYPINNYNVTFYMGKYDEFYDSMFYNNDTLLALYYVMPYNREKAEKHFLQARDVVNFYNEAFGPFPFWNDHFRMVEASYEGMEHQTAIAYGSAYSNSANSLTYLNRNYDYIIVHEAAHEWWGNSVAAADMADIWLHEGFATYAEILFLEHMEGYDQSIYELHNRMNFIYNIWPVVQNRNVNENSFAGGDVYNKGAILLHCLRATINNDSVFKPMLRDFNLAYRDSVIDSDSFIQFVHNYTGSDFTAFFKKFLYETTLPVLSYTYRRKDDGILLRYKWMDVDEGFVMPFSIMTFPSDEAYRLEATTEMQEIMIPGAESFAFYNYAIFPGNCPRNGLTYYRTKCENW